VTALAQLDRVIVEGVLSEALERAQQRVGVTGSRGYAEFKRKYRHDPAGFVRDCVRFQGDEQPADYQSEVLSELEARRRAAVRGPHGLGKTAIASWAVLWFALTRDGEDWKIPTTASAWRQLTKFLWPEIRKWVRRLRWDVIGRPPPVERAELLTLSIKLSTGAAFALASDQSELIEGAHADHLLYVFDEAKTIPEDTWNSAEGAFATGDCYFLAISTPGEPQGRFYDIHRRAAGYEDWWVRHVTLSEAMGAGRINPEWQEQRRRQWGEGSAVYQNRVLGEFATSDETGVIPLAWVEAANERWHEWDSAGRPDGFTCVGVDVGRGGDSSVYALRYGDAIGELRRSNEKDVMPVAGRTAGILTAHEGHAVVDVIGVGAGVVDRLREQGFNVHSFNAGEKTSARDASGELGFVDKRSAAWWHLREMLQDGLCALPPDDLLTGELTAPSWRVMSGGRIKVESKDDVKKRLRRSTDNADAVIQAYWREAVGGSLLDAEPGTLATGSRWTDVEAPRWARSQGSRWRS